MRILNPLEEMVLLKVFNNLIKYFLKNLKKEFHFNQNKIFKKVQILISYLLVTSWIIIPLIITIYQLMSVNQVTQILKEINLKKNRKNHVKIKKNNNLSIKKKKVKKVKYLVIQLKKKNRVKFFSSCKFCPLGSLGEREI